MQKWEYAHVTMFRGKQEYYVNGVCFKFEGTYSYPAMMNSLGKEGWELVHAELGTEYGFQNEFLFKRPLDEK
jgi:hypothetical protein